MQFHLEADELKLLANVLLEEDSQQYDEILNKVMTCDLRFDAGEFEQTADLLVNKKRALKAEISLQPNPVAKRQLESQLALLERVLGRVNEACVMF